MPLGKKHEITGCYPDYLFGFWFQDEHSLGPIVTQCLSIDLNLLVAPKEEEKDLKESGGDTAVAPPPYKLHPDGIAEVQVTGEITKRPTSFQGLFGGTSTTGTAKAIRAAFDSDDVKGIMVKYETPGGNANGMFDLGYLIQRLGKRKPIWAHGEDICASGGILLASYSPRISANESAMVGSIGVLSYLVDKSEQLKRDGIQVIPITTSKIKGAGILPEVTKAHIKDAQRRTDELGDLFFNAVARGRHLTPSYVRDLEARTYVAGEALKRGLIDKVQVFDEAMDEFRHSLSTSTSSHVVKADDKAALAGGPSMDYLALARELSGNPQMTEAQAAEYFRTAAGAQTSLTTAQTSLSDKAKEITRLTGLIPKAPSDPEIFGERAETVAERIGVLVDKGDMSKAQGDSLSKIVKDHASVFCGDTGEKQLARQVLNVFTLGGSNSGIAADDKAKTQAQPQKVSPSTDDLGELSGLTDGIVNQYGGMKKIA